MHTQEQQCKATRLPAARPSPARWHVHYLDSSCPLKPYIQITYQNGEHCTRHESHRSSHRPSDQIRSIRAGWAMRRTIPQCADRRCRACRGEVLGGYASVKWQRGRSQQTQRSNFREQAGGRARISLSSCDGGAVSNEREELPNQD